MPVYKSSREPIWEHLIPFPILVFTKKALVDASLSSIEALRIATLNPAKFLGEEKEFRTVENGKIADLVLLDENPLENISNTKKIYAVIVDGKLFQRNDLDMLLNQVKQSVMKTQ